MTTTNRNATSIPGAPRTNQPDGADRDKALNRDPLSGAPGAHPVGTGAGAASGGAIGAGIGAVAGGPIGAAVGAVAGAVIGGYAGKATAEAVDPTAEETYWEQNYRGRPYVKKDAPFDAYRPAYRFGVESWSKRSAAGQPKPFQENEAELRKEWEGMTDAARGTWENSKDAVRDAWDRVASRLAPNGAKSNERVAGDANASKRG